MPVSDFYEGPSGLVTLSTTTETAICSLFGVTTKRGWAVAVRCKVGSTTAAAGNGVRFRLVRPANTPNASATASGSAQDFSAPASLLQFATAYTVAPTVGVVLADWEVPQVGGNPYTEYPIQGAEWGVPAIANNTVNAGIHVFATLGVATSTPVSADIVWSE